VGRIKLDPIEDVRTANKPMLNTREAAILLDVEPSTLAAWRHQRRGPDYIRMGGSIRYRRDAIEKWVEASTVKAAS
jgi:hypothetical protein